MGTVEITLVYLFTLAIEIYFFGMQRILLEAGRKYDVDLMFLLPRWYSICKINTLIKYGMIIWMFFTTWWLGGIFLVLPLLIESIIPIPNIYSSVYRKRMIRLNLTEEEKAEVALLLGMKEASDPEVQEADILKISLKNYRIYKEIFDEQIECHKKAIAPPDRTNEIPNMNEWRKYGEYQMKKSHMKWEKEFDDLRRM